MEVFERGDYFVVIGTLHDERPWAGGDLRAPRPARHGARARGPPRRLDHRRRCGRHEDATPTPSAPSIEPVFRDLIGLSVARGYTNAVQQRFGRERGCSHVEFLARAMGPVVVQGLTSSGAWQVELGSGEHPIARGRLHVLDQHLPCLDRGRTRPAEDRPRLAAGQVRSTRRPLRRRSGAVWPRRRRETRPADDGSRPQSLEPGSFAGHRPARVS